MPPVRDLSADVHRHQSWLEKLDERVRSLEIGHAALLAKIGVISAIGGVLGSFVGALIVKLIFKM